MVNPSKRRQDYNLVIEFFDTVLSVEVYFGVVYLLVSVFVFVFVFVIVFLLVRLCPLITLIKCLKCHKTPGSLFEGVL